MTINLADCYGGHSAAEIRDAGFDGVMRYLSHQVGKCATPGEIAQYRAGGLIVGLGFEDAAENAMGGRAQGNIDGAFAASVAQQCGYPTNCVINFAVDFEAYGWELTDVNEYFAGVAGYGYETIPYGSADVLDSVCGAGLAPYGWQTEAWSGGRVSQYARLLQDEFGSLYDNDTVIGNISLWGLDQVLPPPVSPPPIVVVKHPFPKEPVVIAIPAHGRTHLAVVEANGNLVWRAHGSGTGNPQGMVLASGVKVGSTPVFSLAGQVSTESAELFLHLYAEKPGGEIVHLFTGPGPTSKWDLVVWPKITAKLSPPVVTTPPK